MQNRRDVVNTADDASERELEALAGRVSATHPEVANLATQAVTEITELRKRLVVAQLAVSKMEASGPEPEVRTDRFAELLERQAEDLAAAHSRLAEIAALCELAEWSSLVSDTGQRPAVLVDDLKRALGRQ